MAFNERLKEARLKSKMTQEQVAEKIGVAKSTFTGYEKGNSEPSMLILSKIMNVLKVDANFLWQDSMDYPMTVSYDEMAHIKKYRELDDYGRESVNLILEREAQRVAQVSRLSEYAKRFSELKNELPISNDDTPKIRTIPYYDKLASAGTGQILWDDLVEFDMEIIDNEKTRHGDFALGVNGDSMEPIYWNTDTVLVQKTQDLQIGEIGVFILDNECYIKELGYKKLISKNPNYPPIEIDENSGAICAGRVLCNLTERTTAEIALLIERKERIGNINNITKSRLGERDIPALQISDKI